MPRSRTLPCILILLGGLALAACRPPPPASSDTSAQACTPQRLQVEDLRVEGRSCRYATGHWHLRVEPALPGLALWRDDSRVDTVLQLFARTGGEAAAAILPTLRAQGHIPPDEECVMAPAALTHLPAPMQVLQVVPVGERLRRLQATPALEVPDPPCGDFGASTHGVRYFIDDPRAPGWVVYVNEGQDGMLVEPRSIEWTP
jgi:hypothetical protein